MNHAAAALDWTLAVVVYLGGAMIIVTVLILCWMVSYVTADYVKERAWRNSPKWDPGKKKGE